MAKTKNQCDLISCFLCSNSLKDWRPVIALNKKNITVKKGQPLFQEGDQVTGIYFVYKGKVKVHQKWDSEKELIIRFAQPGSIVGHLGLGDSAVYPVSATAIEESTVCFISLEFLETSMNINNAFVIKLVRFFANDLQESERRMRNLAHMPVKGRIAQALLSLKTQFGTDEKGFTNIELSRQDLASYTGTSYESLFRSINDLLEENSISISGKKIAIRQEQSLLDLTL